MISPASISVVITTFNRDNLLAEALGSLVSQTLPLHEIIVVDDGGKGNARDISERFGQFVRYLWQENQGQQAARNKGVEQATGEWIAFLDDDDLWEAGRHELIAQMITTGKIDLIFGDFRKFGDGWMANEGYFADHERRHPGCWNGLGRGSGDAFSIVGRFPITQLVPECPFWPSTLVVQRDLSNRIGGWDQSLRGIKAEDIEFVVRAVKIGRLGLLWEPTVRYRCHQGNDSGEGLPVALGRIHVWEYVLKNHELTDAEHRTIANVLTMMRSKALWSAHSEGDYRTTADLSRQIGWHSLSWTERVKTVAARFMCLFISG